MTTKTEHDPVAVAMADHAEAERDFEAAQATVTEIDATLEAAVHAERDAAEHGADNDALERLAAARRSAEDRAGWARSKAAGTAKRLEAVRETVVEAEKAAKRERVAGIAKAIIKADQEVDRARSALGRGLQRRLHLGDEWLVARAGAVGGPSTRQVRGGVHLLAITLAPLSRLFPADLPRPHVAFRETTLAAFERRLFARWLGNGEAENPNP